MALVTDLVIGDNEEAGKEYLFSGATHISTDGKNNIYIADHGSSRIRVFDEKGSFQNYIGRRGQGPGEIIEVTSLLVTSDEELLVSDRMNRRITKFSNKGDYLSSTTISDDQPNAPWQILPLGENHYITRFIDWNFLLLRDKDPAEIRYLHIYDKDFNSVKGSLVRSTDIFDLSKWFERAVSKKARSISFEVVDENKILVVPLIYEGVIYLFQRKGNRWSKQELRGLQHDLPTYTELKTFPKNFDEFPARAWVLSRKKGKYGAVLNKSSEGIWQLNDGHIAHFSVIKGRHKKWYLGMELFDQAGRYRGYGRVKNFAPFDGSHGAAPYMVMLWKDNLDRFYISDYRDDFPVVRRMRLEYEIKDE